MKHQLSESAEPPRGGEEARASSHRTERRPGPDTNAVTATASGSERAKKGTRAGDHFWIARG